VLESITRVIALDKPVEGKVQPSVDSVQSFEYALSEGAWLEDVSQSHKFMLITTKTTQYIWIVY
jgi:hypothetical protein